MNDDDEQTRALWGAICIWVLLVAAVLFFLSGCSSSSQEVESRPHPGVATICYDREPFVDKEGNTRFWKDTRMCKEAFEKWGVESW